MDSAALDLDQLRDALRRLVEAAREAPGSDGRALIEGARFRRRLSEAALDVTALEATAERLGADEEMRVMTALLADAIRQRIGALALEAAGPYAAVAPSGHNVGAIGIAALRELARRYLERPAGRLDPIEARDCIAATLMAG